MAKLAHVTPGEGERATISVVYPGRIIDGGKKEVLPPQM